MNPLHKEVTKYNDKIESLLTMTRSDGFYQMVELMIRKAKE